MSLSNSISNAMSGLTATSRMAQLVSSNLSNALNENYSRQEIELTAVSTKTLGGVSVSGIRRIVDETLLADRRASGASLSKAQAKLSGAKAIESAVGSPSVAGSFPAMLTQFDTALRYAESDPGSQVRLLDAVEQAKTLARSINAAGSNVQALRLQADGEIAQGIEELNQHLGKIVALNDQIVSANVSKRDVNSLLDQRQAVIDQVNDLVPVREMQRKHGAVSLVSKNGVMLIDIAPVRVEFTKSNQVLPHMTAGNGLLGLPSIDGRQFDLSAPNDGLGGGRLQGLFETRDRLAPDVQAQLDGFAFDLAERFQDNPADPSITPNASGLFTDEGSRVTAVDLTGLAGRLALNASVDPGQGGETWRMRSGLQAQTPSVSGDATFITAMIEALATDKASIMPGQNGSIFQLAAAVSSNTSQVHESMEKKQSFASAQFEHFNQMHLANGVDSDAELQRLLTIETNFAANAKVIQTIDEMFAEIMRIT